MSKHTPGPWRVSQEGYIASRQGFVPIRTPFRGDAFRDGPTRSPLHPEAELAANARLIAAAPDLLTALEWIVWELVEGCEDKDSILRVAQEAIEEATPRERKEATP